MKSNLWTSWYLLLVLSGWPAIKKINFKGIYCNLTKELIFKIFQSSKSKYDIPERVINSTTTEIFQIVVFHHLNFIVTHWWIIFGDPSTPRNAIRNALINLNRVMAWSGIVQTRGRSSGDEKVKGKNFDYFFYRHITRYQ